MSDKRSLSSLVRGTKQWVMRYPWLSFLAATVMLAAIIHFYVALLIPPAREAAWQEIEVTRGMSFKALSSTLHRRGVIRYPGYFEFFARMQGITRNVRIGYYGLGRHMSLWQVLRALRKGHIIEYAVTIPEGYNMFQIGYVVAKTPIISGPRQFVRLARDKSFSHSLGVEADTLEGYLFPDTYYFPKGTTIEEVARQMVGRYQALFVDSYRSRAEEIGFTEHQIITLASIIEKEAKWPSERTTISAVYHNRLKKGMKLQADPTAVYGKQAWVRKVTSRDLKRKTRYNTYIYKGLPPGPIANPGHGSILAALHPEPVDYLFFVAQGDGSHFFSKDYATHLRAIERYRAVQQNARRNRNKQR